MHSIKVGYRCLRALCACAPSVCGQPSKAVVLGPGGAGRLEGHFAITNPCRCERIYLSRVVQKSLERSPGNSPHAWIAVEPEPVAGRQQERDSQCRAAAQWKKIEGKRSSLLRGLQLRDRLVTRSSQDVAKRFGCCHHSAVLRASGGSSLRSETAIARPTALDNFMRPPLLLARHGATASIPVEAFYALRVVRVIGPSFIRRAFPTALPQTSRPPPRSQRGEPSALRCRRPARGR